MNIDKSAVIPAICLISNARVGLEIWEAIVRICRIWSHSAIVPTTIVVLAAIVITAIGFYPAIQCLKRWMEEPKNLSNPAFWVVWASTLYLALEVGMIEF